MKNFTKESGNIFSKNVMNQKTTWPGARTIKLFMAVIFAVAYKSRVIATSIQLHIRLKLVGKVRSLPLAMGPVITFILCNLHF